jgi:hypothetical protein
MSSVSLPHSTYFIRQFFVFALFVGYCFRDIMCIWDSCVYQKGVLCFLIHKSCQVIIIIIIIIPIPLYLLNVGIDSYCCIIIIIIII